MVPALAHAQFRTGNQLLTELQSTEVIDRMYALGYVVGVTDTMLNINHCPPGGMTAGQLSDMTKSYLTNNPQVRHFAADGLVLAMLRQSWPCPKKGKGV
jgi:hypothetical protein